MDWTLVLIGAVFVASLLFLAVCSVVGLVRLARAWQREPAHAYPAPEAAERWLPPVFGSMDLEADRDYWESAGPDWREQTAADLDPITLAVAHENVVPLEVLEWPSWADEPVLPPKPEGDMSQRLASGPEGEAYSRGVLPSGPRPDQSGSVTGTKLSSQPEPVVTVAGRLVESRGEWLRRLERNAGPGWTFAGELVAA
jgi:hypothetical protein